jgi:hypothetical protein
MGLWWGLGTPAWAGTIDEASGRLLFEGSSLGISLDEVASLPSDLAPVLLDKDGEPLGESIFAQRFRTDPEGLEGQGYLELGGDFATLQLHLEALGSRFTGRRVELRFWQKPEGTRLVATLTWYLSDQENPGIGVFLGRFIFQPTGRATDDGWEEWTSGPVDFAAAGLLPPVLLEISDVQEDRSWQAITRDRQQRVRLDALEVLDHGPAAVPQASCTRLSQTLACGPMGACVLGRCVDAALRYGPALQDPGLRSDYLDRRLFEFKAFEGGRMPQSLMGALQDRVETLRQETSPSRFWPVFQAGVAALRDGHASGPAFGASASQVVTNLGICIHLGEADLLPHGGRAPLVFSVEGTNPVADLLEVGDVLTAIDGLAPFDWAVAAGLGARHGGDPACFDVVLSPSLLTSALLAGSSLSFARCVPPGPGISCEPEAVQTIEIDLAGLAEETLWAGQVPDWFWQSGRCDYRFRRGVEHPDVSSYSFAGFADDGPVRTLIINGVPSLYWSEEWANQVLAALSPPPAYLILDQRTGSGGGVDATDYIMGLFLTESDFDRIEIVPQIDRTLDATTWAALSSCRMMTDMNDCGGYWRWSLHEYSDLAPSLRGVAGATRVAVLNAMDVSGNDFTSRLFTYRGGPTRIFGPAPTYGAFGPIAELPAHLDELSGGSMQFWDSIFVEQPQDQPMGFATGVGVPPDQIVLQRQSDALAGVDTTIEAARAWLLEE